MANLFTYDRPVTGKNHIGRKDESDTLRQLIESGRNIVIYEPPKSGKSSLIAQTLYAMRLDAAVFNCLEVSLLNVRSSADLLLKLTGVLLDHFTSTPDERAAFAERYLAGTHFVPDEAENRAFSLEAMAATETDARDIRTILSIPYRLAEDRGEKIIVVLDEFQNIGLCEESVMILKLFEDVVRKSTATQQSLCSWIWTGSQVNAMKEIFEKGRWFARMVERVKLGPIPYKEIESYIVRAFLTGGKVIEKADLQKVAESLECNVWYMTHFASICDNLSRGYIMAPVIQESLSTLMAIHEARFVTMMNDITTFQLLLLKAILDGQKHLSSAEVIERYGLNSSANVRRLKDALCRKEIITFEGPDEHPVILDPLFKFWLKTRFFAGR